MRNVQRRSQLQRIGSIVLLLQSKQLSKKDLILALHSKFHKEFCQSQIEKDFFTLKMDFDAEIIYEKKTNSYFIDSSYNFKDALFNYVML